MNFLQIPDPLIFARRVVAFISTFWHALVILFAEYVRKYATEEALRGQENNVSSDSESSMSDFSENEAEDMEL